MRTGTAFINLDYLRLMADGDEEMIQTMLGMLLEELPEEFEKIKFSYQEKNWEELRKVGHKMKSTLAFVGNDELTTANKEIERLVKEELELDRIQHLIEIMDNIMPNVLQDLHEMAR
jgi:HPt (histidine-containing phosphotransfer) domain-containing protein